MAQTTLDRRMFGSQDEQSNLSDHTITASDIISFSDVGDSNLTKKDTVQGVLDLAGGGAMVHLSSLTADNDGSLNFTAFNNSTYGSYRFIFENVLPATNNESFAIRTSSNGGSSYDAGSENYRRSGFWESGGDEISNADYGTLGYFVSTGVTNTAVEGGVSGYLELYNPAGTQYTQYMAVTCAPDNDGGDDITANVFCGHRKSAADVDACQFLFGSGNITSGTIRMYGYVKS